MAKTSFDTSNALVKKAWEEKLFRDIEKETYFMGKFASSSGDTPVHVKTQLEKGQGDKITFGLRMRLAGAGVTGVGTLEGNEEALTTYDCSVSLQQYRHAVRDRGALDRQRAMFSIDDEAKAAIKTWGTEKIDKLCFDTLQASPTNTFYVHATNGLTRENSAATAAADAGLTLAASKLTPALISQIKTWCKTGGARAVVPIRPIRVEGEDMYVLLVHPDAMYDLKINSDFMQARREAMERGKSNPLFKNATALWDGVIIHEHENVIIGVNASSVPYCQGIFMGAQALVWAWGERGEVVQKNFDYENEHGYAYGLIAGVAKSKFNSEDFGSVAVVTARTNISGIARV
jgi:N4-gp56 family major capsid protein